MTKLLSPGDPPPFEIVNPGGERHALLVCDHASTAIPAQLRRLGLKDRHFDLHIASDIGAGDLTRALAARLDTRAVLAGYSRLVIDPNRATGDSSAVPAVSDGVEVPGNCNVDDLELQRRINEIYQPYHLAIERQISQFRRASVIPAILAIHSFTPIMNGVDRPWEVGILWDADPRIAAPLIDMLRGEHGLQVGDNEPYSGRHPEDYTIDHHAEAAGLPHAGIEIRHDLIRTPEGVERIGGILADCLEAILAEPGLYQQQQCGADAQL